MAKYDLQDAEPNPTPTTSGKYDLQDAPPGNPVAAIGSNPDNPDTADLYGPGVQGNYNRFRAGFGDAGGVGNILSTRGYKNSALNKKGDLVAQSPTDGKWYKDAQGFKNPVNWAEGHVGAALPLAGMGAGAVMGGGVPGVLGTVTTGPVGVGLGYAGGIAGAGVGDALGEGARASIGKLLGSNAGPIAPQMEDEGKQGMIGEALGKPLGAAVGMIPGVKPVANWVADRTIRPLLAGVSKVTSLGGTDYDAAKRLLARPSEVMSSTEGDNVANVGAKAAKEMGDTDADIGSRASDVQQAVRGTYKGQRIDTNYETNQLNAAMQKYKPNKVGVGALGDEGESNQSLKILQGWQDLLDKGDTGSPEQTFRSLQKTAKYLSDYGASGLEATGDNTFKTPKLQSIASNIAGSLKDKLHEMSPELAASDAESSAWANGKELLKGFENPATSEQKADSLFGANKTNMNKAAKKYIPQTYEQLGDIGANKSFGQGDVLQKYLGPTGRAVALMGAGGMLDAAAGHPLGILGSALVGGTAAISHPLMQKSLLNLGGRMTNQELPSMAYKSLGPWGLMNSGGDK